MEPDGLPDLDADAAAKARAFRALFDHAPVGICAATLDRHIFAMNPALQRMLGLVDSRGMLVDMLAPPEQVQRLNALIDAVAAGETVSVEGPLIGADGTRIDTRATVMYVRGHEGVPAFALAVITSPDQEVRAQQSADRARLLVHDINNLLLPIVAYAETLLKTLPPSDPARPDAEHIQNLVEKVVTLARASLATPDEGIVDVNGLLLAMRPAASDLLGAGINVVILPELGRPHVRADAGGLERVFLNLLSNARDAMPEGGMLTVETRQEGDSVLIRIADTGLGMPSDVQARVFERGFTTKVTGHGMGLASVRAFAERYGGSFAVESEPGAGTIVTLTLPAAP